MIFAWRDWPSTDHNVTTHLDKKPRRVSYPTIDTPPGVSMALQSYRAIKNLIHQSENNIVLIILHYRLQRLSGGIIHPGRTMYSRSTTNTRISEKRNIQVFKTQVQEDARWEGTWYRKHGIGRYKMGGQNLQQRTVTCRRGMEMTYLQKGQRLI